MNEKKRQKLVKEGENSSPPGGGGGQNQSDYITIAVTRSLHAPHSAQGSIEGIAHETFLASSKITSQRLLDQSQAAVYRGKRHIPPILGLFGPICVPYPKGLNC